MPVKYREMHDFHEYYSGQRTAPCLTVFVGGNHEASNYLFELYYGGWVAPNIYYMGAANVLRLGPLRISGLSGIWKGFDYKKVHHERLPYNQDDVKSIYHVRELDARKLLCIRTQVDIGISHDWPRGVEWKGNWKKLFRQKSHFEEDARSGQLGSVAAKYVMDRLRPPYWFSAHLHCKFAAIIDHEAGNEVGASVESAKAIPVAMQDAQPNKVPSVPANADEIDLDMDEEEEAPCTNGKAIVIGNTDEIDLELEEDGEDAPTAQVAPGQGLNGVKVSTNGNILESLVTQQNEKPEAPTVSEDVRAQLPEAFRQSRPAAVPKSEPISHPSEISNTMTHFLALDKCLPNRDFLQLLSISPSQERDAAIDRPLRLEYDAEWLAITRAFAEDAVVGDITERLKPDRGEAADVERIEKEKIWVEENLVKNGRLIIPLNFTITAPVYDASQGLAVDAAPIEYTNNQTKDFCDMLHIPNPFDISEEERAQRIQRGPRAEEPRRDGGFRGGSRGGGGFGRGRGRGGPRGGNRGRGRGRGRG